VQQSETVGASKQADHITSHINDLQYKLVSGWGLQKRTSVLPYWLI